jgi:hypothetical protein
MTSIESEGVHYRVAMMVEQSGMMRRETGIGRLAASSPTPMKGLPDLRLQTNYCAAANGRDVPEADLAGGGHSRRTCIRFNGTFPKCQHLLEEIRVFAIWLPGSTRRRVTMGRRGPRSNLSCAQLRWKSA